MKAQRIVSKHRHGFVLFVATAIALSACAASAPVIVEELDPETAVTVTRVVSPVVLYRDNSAYAAHARSFVYVGPVRVNRMGQYSHYLWLGIWSTMSDAGPAAISGAFESIVLYADGEPLDLDAHGWTPGSIGLSEPVYPGPAAGAVSAYYPVTLDQIRLIAESQEIRIRTNVPGSETFEPWDRRQGGRASFRLFVESLAF